MFSTVEQFSNLAAHKVEGMEGLMKQFTSIIDDMRRKPYELLDYQKGQACFGPRHPATPQPPRRARFHHDALVWLAV